MKKFMIILGLLYGCVAQAQFNYPPAPPALANITAAEYFIDNDPGFGAANPIAVAAANDIPALITSINLTGLTPGVHQLRVRSVDANGNWSITATQTFENLQPLYSSAATLVNITASEYFIDTDPGFGAATPITITAANNLPALIASINLTGLTPGVHQLQVRSRDANGNWSITATQTFENLQPSYSIASTLVNITAAEYFIDTDPGVGAGTSIPLSPATDVNSLPVTVDLTGSGTPGNKLLFVRSMDANGKWSITSAAQFNNAVYIYPPAPTAPGNIMALEYYIDTDPGFGNATPLTVPGNTGDVNNYVVNLNLGGTLSPGTHHLFIRSKQNPWSITNIIEFTVTTPPSEPTGLLIFEENFAYSAGQDLTANGWTAHAAAGTNPIKVNSTGLNYANYGSTNIGNAALVNNTGEAVNRTFAQQNTGTSTYCAFLINATAALSGGEYVLNLGPTNISSEFRGRFYIREVAGSLRFGVSTNGTTTNYSTTNYSFGTTYLVVLKYFFDGSSQTASVFINPDLNTEPVSADISETSITALSTNIGSVALRQSSATQNVVIDGIRVATGWGAVTGNIQYNAVATIAGGYYNNVSLNTGTTLTTTGMVNLKGALTVNAGATFTTSGNLTLKSDTNGTARVATSAGTINGNVTVERYISAIGRKWRLLSGKSTISAQSIFDSWQEGGGAPVASNRGTWITSTTYNGTNGYDATNNNLSSIFTHNRLVPAWETPATTNTGNISNNQGYMLFVRGDRYDNASNSSNSPTVLRTTGALRQGTLSGVNISSTSAGRTLVGNPYASPIDMEPIFANTPNLDQNMMVWDPSLTGNYGLGGFRSVVRTGINMYDQTPVVLGGTVVNEPTIQFIHSGSAFFLKATGADASVVFNESTKATTPTTVYNPIVATVAGDQQMLVNLMVVQPSNVVSLADGIRVRYNAAYSASSTDDIEKMGNFGENISSFRNGKKLIVEQRPMMVSRDSIFLRMTNTGVKNYRFQVGTVDFVQANATAYLQDTWLNTLTALDLTGNITEVNFSVTTDPASANQDRFRIIFALSGPLPVTITSVKAAQTTGPGGQGSTIAVEWKASNQFNMKEYEVEKSTDGVNYTKVNTQAATGTNGSDVVYNWLDVNPVTGVNYYRIRSIGIGGDIKISQVVTVKIVQGKSAITIYPNPVINNTIGLQFTDMQKGIYLLRLVNSIGQVVLTKNINHTGGSATETVAIAYGLAKGAYRLEIIKPDNSKTTKTIFIVK